MKKFLLIALPFVFLLISCTKEESLNKIAINQKVNFSISGFTKDVKDLESIKSNSKEVNSLTGTDLKKFVNLLIYKVYDKNDTFLHYISQKADDPNFGTISDHLPKGEYHIIFVGMMTNLNPDSVQAQNDEVNINFIANVEAPDIFVKKIILNVGDMDVSQDISLDRIMGQLEINIEDMFPQEADKIVMKIQQAPYIYRFNIGDVNGTMNTQYQRILYSSDKISVGYKWKTFLCGSATNTMNVSLQVYSSGRLIAEKVISGVKVYANKRTILSGKLFDVSTSTSNININDKWSDEAINIGF